MIKFNDYFNSTILGVIQGLTEFLPISSTAHINLTHYLLGNREELSIFFETFLHLGSLFALLFYFRKTILFLLRNFYKNDQAKKITINFIIAFIPLVVIGGIFGSFLKAIFPISNISYSLFFGGMIMILVSLKFSKLPSSKQTQIVMLSSITPLQAFLIGCSQIFAIIPGVSRSGATILAGILTGLNHAQAFTFSFFLALPTMFGASVFSIIKNFSTLPNADEINLALWGFLGAFIFSLITFKYAQKFISHNKNSLIMLGTYRIIFSAILKLFKF